LLVEWINVLQVITVGGPSLEFFSTSMLLGA
jgi:hypothetical protein